MLFTETTLSASNKAALDHEGHVLLPRRLTPEAQAQLITALADIEAQTKGNPVAPRHYAAEHNAFLASLIAHPEMLALAQAAIGPELRFDHCVALNRAGGDRGVSWHSHDYAEERPELGFVRIFFYVNGFHQSDGGLKAVPGSHLFRDPKLSAHSDDALREGWLAGKIHPLTVTPRQPESPMRWCVVYAYRNPGAPLSPARWITPEFEKNPPPGATWLMPEQ